MLSILNGEAEGKSASARINEAHKPNAVSANSAEPARDFWAVLQANSARMASGCQRFPRSAESELHNARGKPHRSPNPWQNRRPFPAKPPRSRGVRPRAKSDVNMKREQGDEGCSRSATRPGKGRPCAIKQTKRRVPGETHRLDAFRPTNRGRTGGDGACSRKGATKSAPQHLNAPPSPVHARRASEHLHPLRASSALANTTSETT